MSSRCSSLLTLLNLATQRLPIVSCELTCTSASGPRVTKDKTSSTRSRSRPAGSCRRLLTTSRTSTRRAPAPPWRACCYRRPTAKATSIRCAFRRRRRRARCRRRSTHQDLWYRGSFQRAIRNPSLLIAWRRSTPRLGLEQAVVRSCLSTTAPRIKPLQSCASWLASARTSASWRTPCSSASPAPSARAGPSAGGTSSPAWTRTTRRSQTDC
mmetsp:Transcript_37769/g.108869  ORF Transcript_37769/g.108869 Transcript_37769/m.108869 type:complete len:212 (+) Transcript_37769:1238-1873(+)